MQPILTKYRRKQRLKTTISNIDNYVYLKLVSLYRNRLLFDENPFTNGFARKTYSL